MLRTQKVRNFFYHACCVIICLEGLTSCIVDDFILEMRDTLRKSYIL